MSAKHDDEGYHRFMLAILYEGRNQPGPAISLDAGGGKTLVVDKAKTLATVRRQARNNHSYPKLCWTCGGWSRSVGGEAKLHTDDHPPIWNGESPS